MEKNILFQALPESPKAPPPDPNSGNLVLFFLDAKIVGRGGRYINNLKTQLKVQYIGIFEEIDSFC